MILIVESLPLRVHTERAEEIGWRQALCDRIRPVSGAVARLFSLGGDDPRRTRGRHEPAGGDRVLVLPGHPDDVRSLEPGDWPALALSFVVSFLVAWVSIRWLLRYVSTHSFRLFAWYRIVLGFLIMLGMSRL